MAYLGRQPVLGNFVKLDAITVVNGQAAYTMQNGGVNFTDYTTVNQFLVSLNGTIQAATDSFTVSGSTITFASNLSTGDVIDFIIVFGNSLSAGTVSDSAITTAKLADSSVTTAKINDNAITLDKMASGTDGNIISYDASGNPVAVGPGTDGQVLTSTGAGSPPAFEAIPSSNPYTAISKAEAGYITLVGGLIIQWGVFGTFGGTVSTGSVNFPITFPNARFSITTSLWNGNSSTLNSLVLNSTISTSGFTWYQPDTSQSGRVGAYIVTGH